MNKAFEKILERLDELIEKSYYSATEGNRNAGIKNSAYHKVKKIVQEVAEEYSYLSKGFDNGLLKRIADYFSSVYEGDDKTAPKMELSVNDLRYIANLNVEKCRLQTEVNNLKKLYKETP